MVSRNSLLLSRRTGVLTAIGIAAGVCVHVAYTLGVGLLIQQSLWLFNSSSWRGRLSHLPRHQDAAGQTGCR